MANLQATTLAKETGTTELHHEPSALGLTPPAWVAFAMLCVIGIMPASRQPSVSATISFGAWKSDMSAKPSSWSTIVSSNAIVGRGRPN